ncbi:MAG TPA: hypothetical protein V6D23_21115 [Candidatus Obscuribacterales bacterium]
MAMEGIYNVPEFNYLPRVEKHGQNPDGRQKQEQDKKKKKKEDDKASALFESLADSLGQYSDEPFQFNG